jgi:hypothetical protein
MTLAVACGRLDNAAMKRTAIVSGGLVVAATFAAPAAAAPDHEVLKRFAGDWDVTVTMTRPVKLVVRYSESAVLAPGGKLLRSSTSVRPDGSQDWSMMLFDKASGGYPLWIFSSTGAVYPLAPGKWDDQAKSMTWEAPPGSPVSHVTHCSFSDERTKSCETLVKNWKGGVMLEQSYTATRRDR